MSKDQTIKEDEIDTTQIVEEETLEDVEIKIGKLLKNQP
jgi:hypothetical protein